MFDVLYWIQAIFYRSVINIHHSILAICYWRKSKTVPPIKNSILLKSANELAEDIRNGKLKSEYVVQSYIDRIQEVEPYLNAVVQNRFKEALKEATEVDELLQSGTFSKQHLEEKKPLLGVPITVKVLIKVKDYRFTACSKVLKDVVADKDATCVTLLKNAGGIVIAITNSPEFGLGVQTINSLYGKTCNPYDTSRTSGGSSGGESALLAAGASAVGIGNDLGGSLRFPAHFCGLYAHKPTKDLIPNGGSFPLDYLDSQEVRDFLTTGPICRFVEDVVVMMKVLTAESRKCVNFDQKVDFKNLKIFYATSIGDPKVVPVDKEIVEGIHKAMSYFKSSYGVKAEELKLPLFNKTIDIYFHLLRYLVEESVTAITSDELRPFSELLKLLVGNSNYSMGTILAIILLQSPILVRKQKIPFYRELLKKLTEEFDNLLDDNSVFICPVFPQTAPYHYELNFCLCMSICYTSLCNVTGMPSTAIPMGMNRNGMPQGVQIIGAKNNDHLTIACAVELNKVFGGWIPPLKVKPL